MNNKNNNTATQSKDQEIEQDLQDLVIERIRTMPREASISIGNKGTYSPADLIEHIRNNDDVGQESVKVHVEYIRALNELPLEQE